VDEIDMASDRSRCAWAPQYLAGSAAPSRGRRHHERRRRRRRERRRRGRRRRRRRRRRRGTGTGY